LFLPHTVEEICRLCKSNQFFNPLHKIIKKIKFKNLLKSLLELKSVYCSAPSIWFSVFRAGKKEC
jgi:hypothetical protein